MKRIKVPCWEVNNYRPRYKKVDKLYVTYPEDNKGYDLITCLNCGAIYAASVATYVYVGPPLVEKLKIIQCTSCGNMLSENYALYPDTYFTDGEILHFQKSMTAPDDGDVMWKEFESIYD